MSRDSSIWRRAKKGDARPGHWYTSQGRKKLFVADREKTRKEAFEIFCANYSAPPADQITVKLILHRYLTWVENNRNKKTHAWHQYILCRFAETISEKLTVVALKKFQIQDWLDGEETWSGTSKNRAVASLRSAFNWAISLDYITVNPATTFKAPKRSKGRQLWLDDAQFKVLLTHVPETCFQDYLTFAFDTGARPQETRILEARHWDGEKFTLSPEESKGGNDCRVIYCNDRSRVLVERLVKIIPEGPIFHNQDGKPWTPNAVRSRFLRTPKKKGQPKIGLAVKMKMKGLCAYTMRHSFCTNALIRGLDVVTVAALMGHKDATMVMRVYQHLAKNHAYLLKSVNRATAVPDALTVSTVPVPPIPLQLGGDTVPTVMV